MDEDPSHLLIHILVYGNEEAMDLIRLLLKQEPFLYDQISAFLYHQRHNDDNYGIK